MSFDPKIHHRRSIRLQRYDYSQAGAYFITISTSNHVCNLGEITNGDLVLSDFGKIAAEGFELTQEQFQRIMIQNAIVMPNHIHMVVEILDSRTGGEFLPPHSGGETPPLLHQTGGETPPLPLSNRTGEVSSPIGPISNTQGRIQQSILARIIAYYKYQTTKQINLLRKSIGIRFWQRNYYEHIIRDEAEYARILLYIEGNPQKWIEDQLHPDSPPNRFNQGT